MIIILKFLVIIFFLKHLKYLFTGESLLKKTCRKILETAIEYDGDMEIVTKNNPGDMMGLLIVSVLGLLSWFIGLAACFFLLQYDPTYITIVFIILTLVNFMIYYIEDKNNKFKKPDNGKFSKEEIHKIHIKIEEMDKITFKKIMIRIINAAYWSYAIYLMFLM